MFKTSVSTKNVMNALFRAQTKFQTITKSANNPFFKSKYADLNSILDAITPAFHAEGIMLLQPVTTDGTNNYVTTRLQHVESEEFLESTVKLELSKLTMQEIGSAISYGRRYTLQSLPTLQMEDDDANIASKNTVRSVSNSDTQAQVKETVVEGTSFRKPKVAKTTDEGWM